MKDFDESKIWDTPPRRRWPSGWWIVPMIVISAPLAAWIGWRIGRAGTAWLLGADL